MHCTEQYSHTIKTQQLMEHITIKTDIKVYKYDELDDDTRQLAACAKDATNNSYSPYSGFCVGAAIRLDEGTIIKGANQENAAFSVTMCAERAAIFNAQSNCPQKAITDIAIAAKNANGFVTEPVSPCGSCRQVLLEMEQRYNRDIRVHLCGAECIYTLESVKDLMPLSFVDKSMR